MLYNKDGTNNQRRSAITDKPHDASFARFLYECTLSTCYLQQSTRQCLLTNSDWNHRICSDIQYGVKRYDI